MGEYITSRRAYLMDHNNYAFPFEDISSREPVELIEDFENKSPLLAGINNRRSDIEIIAVILKIAQQSSNKTKILYHANLSHKQLQKFLGYLLKNSLMIESESRGRKTSYKTTLKGRLFLSRWLKAISLLA